MINQSTGKKFETIKFDEVIWFNRRTKEKYNKYFTRINIWLEGKGLEL